MYSNGLVNQSDAKAAKWYEKAANNGDVHAQAKMASLYDQGLGVERSLDRARYWFREAAKQGYPWTAEELQHMNEQNQEFDSEKEDTPSENEPVAPVPSGDATNSPVYAYDEMVWARLNGTFPHTMYEQTAQILEFLRERYDNGVSFETSSDLRKIKHHLNTNEIPEKVWDEVKSHLFSPDTDGSENQFYYCWEHVVTEEGLRRIWEDVNRTVGKLGLYEPKAVFERHDTQLKLDVLSEPKALKKMVEAAFPEFEEKAFIRLVESAKKTLGESLAEFISEDYGGRISFDELEKEGFMVSTDKLKKSALYASELLMVKDDEIRTKGSMAIPDGAYEVSERFLEAMREWGVTVYPSQMKEMLNKSFGFDVQDEWCAPDSFFEDLINGSHR